MQKERDREKEDDLESGYSESSEPRREIIPLGLSLSKRGIVSRPTHCQDGRGRELPAD